MENERERIIASKLRDYVDGKGGVSDADWADLSADVETIALLRLGFGEVESANEVFSRRLRRELVEGAGQAGASRRWGAPGWALAAASVLLLIASGLLIQKGITGRRTATEMAKETAAERARPAAPERAELEAPASLADTGSSASEFREVALTPGGGEGFRMEPFSGASEVRIERVTIRWRESRMNTVYERYSIERGGE